MENSTRQNGYVIQLYQYARRYRYNRQGVINYINYLKETPEHGAMTEDEKNDRKDRGNNSSHIVLGDFDILEVIPVDSFRKYHDVSELAKKYLGRRQSVLLYCIEDKDLPAQIKYNCDSKSWYSDVNKFTQKRFFCLSLLSITNEAHSSMDNVFTLLRPLRKKILEIVAHLNENLGEPEKLICDVFGALNATEIGIVWLCNQYVDVLMIIDYLKHMKLHLEESNDDIPLFLASNTTIATKFEEELKENENDIIGLEKVEGTASVRISFHDEMEKREEAKQLIEEITGNGNGAQGENKFKYSVLYSSGEYDLVIQMPASHALMKIQKGGILNNCKRENNGLISEKRQILRNNTQLLLEEGEEEKKGEAGKKEEEGKGKSERLCRLESEISKQEFLINVSGKKGDEENPLTKNSNWKEWMELADPASERVKKEMKGERLLAENNYSYYMRIRREMGQFIRPSAGMIDMLDLMYADYLSTISSAYNKTWVYDFHHQFKAVLHAISLWLEESQRMANLPPDNKASHDRQWKDFADLTNAFKQQVYHLSQSSRMVLEIPRCHFRMTGQYDLLIHTYYGFAKIILETIYLMQGRAHQAELVPLVTVNTVPQVNSEVYFQYGNNDRMRTVNLIIPASIIFDPQRGLRYLVHEIFHYAAPPQREKRNYLMGCFIISECLKMQFIHIFHLMLYMSVDGTIDRDLKHYLTTGTDDFGMSKLARAIFFTHYTVEDNELFPEDYWLDKEILGFVRQNADKWRHWDMVGDGENDIGAGYQRKLLKYCQEECSLQLFEKLCNSLMNTACENFEKYFSNWKNMDTNKMFKNLQMPEDSLQNDLLDKLFDRFRYCFANKRYSALQFSGFRANVAENERIRAASSIIWESLREACSDIAMVSLTSMEMDDYFLFCVQAWKDSSCGLESVEKEQWLRCGLVCEYYQRGKWKQAGQGQYKNNFIRKYQAFYTSKKYLETAGISEAGINKNIYHEAEIWWETINRKYRGLFRDGTNASNLVFYDLIFAEILADFDVRKAAGRFNGTEREKRLNAICDDIQANVYSRYNALLDKYFFEGTSGQDSILNRIKDYRNDYFRENLFVAQHFQKQKTLRELAAYNLKIREEQGHIDKWIPEKHDWTQKVNPIKAAWEIHVRSLEELLFYLQDCEKKMKGDNEKEPIWFRGQSKKDYKLVPSVMRNYDKTKRLKYKSLREYQQFEFEEFKYCADGVPEIPSGVRFTLSDYIALMQHYFIATSFLDWSENAFSALYFALEDYFEKKGSLEDVSLYLLKPVKYNGLCREVIGKRRMQLKKARETASSEESDGRKKTFADWLVKNVPGPEKWIDSIIPNLSTKPNEEKFASYLLGNMKFDRKFEEWSKNPDYEKLADINTNLCLPVAIRTSRLNTRIRMQSGSFVAFNLYTPPLLSKHGNKENNHAFDHVSLEEIQRKMLEEPVFDQERDNIFLYKITIDHCCCSVVMEWLRGMGIARSSVYPELELLKERF